MRIPSVLGCLAILILAGCGGTPADQQAVSARGEVLPDVAAQDDVRRALSPELPGDDPAFLAAIDAFDPEVLEERIIAVSGLRSDDLGGGYFGQRFSMSLWTPVPADVAMNVCHELVTYANEIDFPATEIAVRQKTYADLESSEDLVAVDAAGACVAA